MCDQADVEKLEDRPYAFWEREIHALVVFLVKNRIIAVDELRRAVEALEPVFALLPFLFRASERSSESISTHKTDTPVGAGHVPYA